MNHLKSYIEKLKLISKENTPVAIIAYSAKSLVFENVMFISSRDCMKIFFLHKIIPFFDIFNKFIRTSICKKMDPDFRT